MKRALAVALLAAGCAKGWPTEVAETEQEIAVVQETALAAERHGVSVRAVITDKREGDDGRAGWLKAGVAYFYAPEINTYPVSKMRELAVHEVCHAVGGYPYNHDVKHWCCMKLDGEVGYPPPVTVMGAWPTCE